VIASTRPCAVDGCTRFVHARDWCGTHYARWARLGTVDLPERAKATCSAEDCARPVYSNGRCVTHDQRIRRLGTLELPPVPTLAERLATGITVTEAGCWLWNGRPGRNGYGRISIGNRVLYVHRVSYEHHVGPIPAGLTIDHLCRVRLCVRPDHLEPVTRAENTRREARALRRSS
jgi:hypothetical protein